MFEVSVTATFASAHFLRDYKGKCENLHGHNYKVEVTCEGPELDHAGMLVDFVDLKRATREVVDRLDHKHLNETPPFDVWNPSAEYIALYFYQEVRTLLGDGGRISKVRVWETDTCVATYRP